MLDLVSISRSKSGRIVYFCCAVIACLLVTTSTALSSENSKSDKNIISMVSAHVTGSDLALSIHGSISPTYTVFELFKPARIVVDVANAISPDPDKISLPENLGVQLSTQLITDSQPELTRFEFTLDHSYTFTTKQESNTIVILVKDFVQKKESRVRKDESMLSPSKASIVPSVESQLPKVNPMEKTAETAQDETAATMKENFNFSGYNKEHITVDFYKIDIHNVFRLLRDVSGVNIVVDEAVNGSLTLALNDVPWDFALDIIINLKDLAKKEQFNTIVIYPKDKEFSWPERAEDNLSFEADEEMIVQESLVIQQQENLPKEIVQAKKLMSQARQAEKHGDIEKAIELYENALKLWTDNSRLANKIASLYLVQLRQNAKAAFYADKAIQLDKNNSNAALNAAIANANMQENSQAQQYFEQSVSVRKPAAEALLSYAAFSEKTGHFKAAAHLLEKHDKIYGQKLASLVARARILDEMGEKSAATEMYKAIMLAGFRVPPDLKKYIQNRIKTQ
jgi:type IV pilus assembly protein PilQ